MLLALVGSIALPMPATDDAMFQPIDDASLAAVHAGVPAAAGAYGVRSAWFVPTPVLPGTELVDNWWAEDGALLLVNGIRPVTVRAAALGYDFGSADAFRIVLDIRITASTRAP